MSARTDVDLVLAGYGVAAYLTIGDRFQVPARNDVIYIYIYRERLNKQRKTWRRGRRGK